MVVQFSVGHPLTWKTFPTSTFTGGPNLGSVLHAAPTSQDSMIFVTGPNNRASFQYSPTRNEMLAPVTFTFGEEYLFDSAGGIASQGDKSYWLFGGENLIANWFH
jgi:hypothetical protein